MRVLITGICGFAGSTIARALRNSRENVEIAGIDNFSRKGSETNFEPLRKEGIEVRKGDVRRFSDLAQFPKIDWLIDAAANPSVLAGVDGKTSVSELIDCNLVGTVPMLEFCRERLIPFSLLSTSRVYSIPSLLSVKLERRGDSFAPIPGQGISGLGPKGISEKFSTEPPLSLYGMSKLCSELLSLEYSSTFDFPVWINRCGVMAGAGQFGKPDQGIFSYWIHSWVRRQPLKYLGFGGRGYQVRDCLHPLDLIPLLWKQFDAGQDQGKPKTINVSGGIGSSESLAGLSRWCAERNGEHSVLQDGSDRRFDLPWVVLDNSLAGEIWDWRPQITKEAIFREILDHAELNPGWLGLSK